MLLSLIYFLPCVVSLLWFFSFILKKKSYRNRLFCYAEGISIGFYLIYGIYIFPDIDYVLMVRIESIGIPLGVLFPAVLVAYMYMHCYGRKLNDRFFFALIIPAIVVGVAVNLLCHIIGFDNAAEISRQFAKSGRLVGEFDTSLNQLYCFFTYNAFIYLGCAYMLMIYIECFVTLYRQGYRFGDIFRFFFRGKATSHSRAIAVMYITELTLMIPPVFFGGVFVSKHIYLGIFLTVALAAVKHIIAYLEFYSDNEENVTLYELSHLSLFNANMKNNAEMQEEENDEQDNKPVLTPAHIKMDKRLEQFRQLMEEEQVWKDEDLTANLLCERIGIGKTTLSFMISQQYNSTFRDIVNNYRIEEAKRYMKENPDVKQETVALHCGFKNAQYFNTIFKKLEGETPAMWLARK